MSQIVLIGGSYGIGRSMAEQLLAEGHEVLIASRSNDDICDGAEYIQFDCTDSEADFSEFPEIIDGFAYCPGSINLKPFTSLKEQAFKEDMEINFHSMVRTLQHLMPSIKKGTDPSIVLFSTVAVRLGLPFHSSVAAAKGAVEGFARALAAEFAPKIRVNVVAPSLTETPLADRIVSNEKMREASIQKHPLKRIGTSDDIASMASLLLGNRSSWISGQVISVDGGMGTLRP